MFWVIWYMEYQVGKSAITLTYLATTCHSMTPPVNIVVFCGRCRSELRRWLRFRREPMFVILIRLFCSILKIVPKAFSVPKRVQGLVNSSKARYSQLWFISPESARSQVFVYLCASRLYIWLHRGKLDKFFFWVLCQVNFGFWIRIPRRRLCRMLYCVMCVILRESI
jgi:hypothetical protein